MANPKDPNSPPIPVPETMEEFRARKAAADAGVLLIHVDDESELTVLNSAREKLRAIEA